MEVKDQLEEYRENGYIKCFSCNKNIETSDSAFLFNTYFYHYNCLDFEQRFSDGIVEVFDRNKNLMLLGEVDAGRVGEMEAEEMYYDFKESYIQTKNDEYYY